MNPILDSQRRLRNGWWILAFLLLLALLLLPARVAADRMGGEVTAIQQVAMIAAATWVCQLLRREPLTAVVCRLDRRWIRELLLGGLIGSLLMLLPALILLVSGRVEWQLNPAGSSLLWGGALPLLSAAVAEELLFRGFVFQRLIAGLGPWPAQGIVAGFFLLTHLDNPGLSGGVAHVAGANLVLASILFGVTWLRTRSLAMPIGLHFMANFMQGSVLGFAVSGQQQPRWLVPAITAGPEWLTGGPFGLEGSVPGLCCIAATILLFRGRTGRT
jgi:membrane protease YdiL (CAAX protease family)